LDVCVFAFGYTGFVFQLVRVDDCDASLLLVVVVLVLVLVVETEEMKDVVRVGTSMGNMS